MRTPWLLSVSALCLGMLPNARASSSFADAWQKWHSERLERLRAPDGWLTLIGLFWLEPGDNTVGASEQAEVRLTSSRLPPILGRCTVQDNSVTFVAAPGARVLHAGTGVDSIEMRSDRDENPTLLEVGSIRLQVIERDGRLAIRARDTQASLRGNFPGVSTFAPDVRWQIPAVFSKHAQEKQLAIPTAQGTVSHAVSPGFVRFTWEDKKYTLDVLSAGPHGLFIVFADGTSGKSTYGAGRFLYAPTPNEKGDTIVDFNRAYNPPCAFTPYATCPLPPSQNRLPFAVEAGEKKYR